ncbi:GntR family transcriptional regulator, phosphonate transport system regulatory protein [Enhydrobacter aerosaccus]|uniref:GntR family transcriptional regulator, phosphonate transport system regulatory protein n=1 Tax=Enhydrobacter aerosaccus TaxID=225324 RepID=A0A1T4PDP5_9HYPH|nr:GntR family transcriptional regulator [Enhydrobacter aerosaccus]SJZ89491.1 GntR family transcriptional regulator, phosphonate transport system regulatory protein [Enhydrobacter aerosaccus]
MANANGVRRRPGASSAPRKSLGYADIAELVRQAIPATYPPGSKIASERELADEFKVNRHTVRRALSELERQGLITTVHGSGSIVARRRMEHRLSYDTRFTTSAELAGMSATTTVVQADGEPTSDEIALAKALVKARPNGKLVTARYANGTPVCWIRHLFFGLDVDALASTYKEGSLHKHIDRQFGVRLRRRESHVSADRPSPTDVRLLFVPLDLPILCANSVNVNAETGQPVELSLTRFRSDAVDLRFDYGPAL